MKQSIKKTIDLVLSIFSVNNQDKILKEINKYEYVSFDIFDTLIKRNVFNEKNIFKIIEHKYNAFQNKKINDFYETRILAEKKAKSHSCKEEITLDDIYSFLPYSKEIKLILKQIEQDTEIEYCTKNLPFYKIYNYCLSKKKKIIITSDMYLPKEVIEKILEKNDYKKYYKLYISSEHNATKSKGTLFKLILENNKISKKKIIHIGDNPRSDFLRPRILGFKSLLISTNVYNLLYIDKKKIQKELNYNIISACANNVVSNNTDFFYNIGATILAPLLLGFCANLKKSIVQNNVDKMFFLSRDAKIIMDAYLKLYPEDKDKCHYMYISRKSVTFVELADAATVDDFITIADSIIKRKKIYNILEILELDVCKYKAELYSKNIKKDFSFDALTKQEQHIFFECIKKELIAFAKKQRKLFEEYLDELKFNGKVNLVDIGWKGTIQQKIQSFCEKNNRNCVIYGYYMGVYNPTDQRKGFLYNGAELNKYKIYLSIGFFETLFLNNEGSTIYYKKLNSNVLPVKEKYEQNANLNHKVKLMHDAALFTIDKIPLNSIDKNISFYNYEKVVVKPTIKFLKKIKNLNFSDGKVYQLIEKHNIIYYIMHPMKFKEDLINSYYKIGFLKNLLKINLPYLNILKFFYILYIKGDDK